MPLYEYVCKRCSHTFEELSSVSEHAPCPACQAKETDRVAFSRTVVGKASQDAGHCPPMGCGNCSNPAGPGACGLN